MKPAAFTYHDPATVDEVVALLGQYGDEAKLLAGGQSLVPVLNMRLAKPAHLIDLGKVAELSYIRVEGEYLAIGAMTRHHQVESDALVQAHCPLLAEAIGNVGHIQIRNRGTLGGSLVHADPAAELPGVARALDAVFVVRGPDGTREIAAADLFLMFYTTTIDPSELLVEVRFPLAKPRTGTCFLELARRSGDFALCGVAASLELATDGTIASSRIALIGVGMTPVRAEATEQALKGQVPSAELFAHAGTICMGEVEPETDIHGTAEYRQQLAQILTTRALLVCAQRAKEQAEGGAGR